MSEKNKIFEKIKKCMALSRSSNEHEAAAALRQARALMDKHNIDDADMLTYEVSEQHAKSSAKCNPANYETALASKIADSFGCVVIFLTSVWNKPGTWNFIGCGEASEIASYSFQVLLRQCKNARSEHIKTNLKRCKLATKTRRADMFCEGWIYSVSGKIAALINNERQADALDSFISKHYPSIEDGTSRNRNKGRKLNNHDCQDFNNGFHAGKNAALNRGVNGAEQLALGQS